MATSFDKHLEYLETMMKELSFYEKKGLDTSSLRLFIKNLKTFQKLQKIEEINYGQNLSFEKKLQIIKSFLQDKKAFPRINDVIDFANKELGIDFIDQKKSREITIKKVIGRVNETPELKEQIKEAVLKIRNQKVHSNSKKTKEEIESVESFSKWAEILRNI
ncbi:MAG: hypothetical protein ACO1O6_08245 [Bacteroidota bacterium]